MPRGSSYSCASRRRGESRVPGDPRSTSYVPSPRCTPEIHRNVRATLSGPCLPYDCTTAMAPERDSSNRKNPPDFFVCDTTECRSSARGRMHRQYIPTRILAVGTHRHGSIAERTHASVERRARVHPDEPGPQRRSWSRRRCSPPAAVPQMIVRPASLVIQTSESGLRARVHFLQKSGNDFRCGSVGEPLAHRARSPTRLRRRTSRSDVRPRPTARAHTPERASAIVT